MIFRFDLPVFSHLSLYVTCPTQLMIAVWKWAPAIAAGNTVVLKPAETTPLSTLLMAQLMGRVLPPGVFNVVCGTAAVTGTLLVEHPVPAMASVTGSVRAGRQIAASAAKVWFVGKRKELVSPSRA